MPRPAQDVTDAELAVLQALWDCGGATVRELTERLYPEYSATEHATVQKLLERLDAKGCVCRHDETWPRTFTAAIDRGDLIERKLQQAADKLCDGSIQPLLTHLVRGARLSAKDRQSLRTLLDELDKEGRKSGKK
jgi:predicted transcriptional regulator